MGRKSKSGPLKKSGGAQPKSPINRTKRDKNIFKVADAKGKKKPKEVRIQLKKIKMTSATKRAEVDSTLKTLHEDLVTKKNKITPPPKVPKAEKPPVELTKVSQGLKKL